MKERDENTRSYRVERGRQVEEHQRKEETSVMEPHAVVSTEGVYIRGPLEHKPSDTEAHNQVLTVTVPRWQYEAFRRWFVPSSDRDGVDAFVGRPRRRPGG